VTATGAAIFADTTLSGYGAMSTTVSVTAVPAVAASETSTPTAVWHVCAMAFSGLVIALLLAMRATSSRLN
jgi:hypothetical protein